ncbi:MAG TPA: hypothetical protein VFA33_05005 [Bryobacteraceae bacterium]|nr:hypothetical protein [Bryobacteraceae bacterium]
MPFKWLCRHSWGFPRRWPEFDGQRNVDVQTCSKCGTRRISPIQFGIFGPTRRTEEQPAEVRP